MIQKIKRSIILAITSLTILTPGLVPALASTAYANDIADNVCKGSNQAAGQSAQGVSCNGNGSSLDIGGIAKKIVNIFSVIVGAVAIIMIIYGGFRYITSGGDSGGVGTAKNTIIYAIVGLIIVALAQVIVHFVLNTAGNAVNSGSGA